MVVLDATVVNVALPSIQKGLHFSPASLQWVVNAYTLIFGGFLLLGGRAGDLLGRKRLFVVGVALFSAASLLNGLAQSSGMLIVGRGLQGLGGALALPRRAVDHHHDLHRPSERTKALGVWSAIAAGGGAVGLILGGALTAAGLVGVDLHRQRPGRDRDRARHLALRPRVAGRPRAPDVRPGRRGHGHRRPGGARLRDRQGAVVRLGLGAHGRADCRRAGAAGGVRGDRAAKQGAARSA